MRIVFFGSAGFGIPCLEAIVHSRHDLAGLFTQPARPAGRRRDPRPTEVALWALQNNRRCIEAENINSAFSFQQVADCQGDLLVVIAFGQKIGRAAIDLFPKGAVNVHASLLPKYRGAGPIFWALMNGETQTGISIITLDERMDAGQILTQSRIQIDPEDTFQTLHDKLSVLSPQVLLQTIEAIESGTAVYTPQDPSQVTLAPKLRKEHGYIDWARPADCVVNQIRALWPWPGAQAVYVSGKSGRSSRVTIKKAHRVECSDLNHPACGLLNENLDVWCGCDALRIEELKPAGSTLMSFDSFVNGRACRPGDLFLPMDQVLKGALE